MRSKALIHYKYLWRVSSIYSKCNIGVVSVILAEIIFANIYYPNILPLAAGKAKYLPSNGTKVANMVECSEGSNSPHLSNMELLINLKKERSTESIRRKIWKGAINGITWYVDRSIICLNIPELSGLVSFLSKFLKIRLFSFIETNLSIGSRKRLFGTKWCWNNYFITLKMKDKGNHLELGKMA